MSVRRLPRWLSLASLACVTAIASSGCASESAPSALAQDDAITQIPTTDVKRQSIGNCWIYSTTSWLETLHLGATGETVNMSESWLTYWNWYEQLVDGQPRNGIATGGWFGMAEQLIDRYGLMKEGDFLPAEAEAEMSGRQQAALDTVLRSLFDGPLSDPGLRADRAAVRRELDAAWGLDPAQTQRIDAIFGAGVDRTLETSEDVKLLATANGVVVARDFAVRLVDPTTREVVIGTLADAMGESQGLQYHRKGPFAFNQAVYPRDPVGRRAFWKRVQRALHDQTPVITSWFVDFNALTREAHFSKAELDRRGPGQQGGHMTVMHDYQAEVPGLGLLEAGKVATPEEMERALSDETVIQFVRVKNSWGGIRPDQWDDVVALPGYQDLEMTYLDGPIKECAVDQYGRTVPDYCPREKIPLSDVILPAGY